MKKIAVIIDTTGAVLSTDYTIQEGGNSGDYILIGAVLYKIVSVVYNTTGAPLLVCELPADGDTTKTAVTTYLA